MFALFLLFIGAQAITYDEMKEYNCYTPRRRENTRDLRCGIAIDEKEQCEEMCRTAETVAKRDSSPGKSYKGLVDAGEQLCEITFSGRCASKTFRRDEDDLCFTINTKARGYNQAVEDCEDNGGSLYVPNSDHDLRRLINLTNSKISKFWFGGGSVFFRTCRDPSMGKNEEVAVQYIITEDDDRFLGYATTRLTSDKAPYICAIPRDKKDGTCLSFSKPTPPPTTTPEPPKCSFKYININNQMWLWDACFPDGPLKIGDTLVIEGVQPACCPAVAGNNPVFGMYSFNLHTINKVPWLHVVCRRDWKTMLFDRAPNGWGNGWNGPSYLSNPFVAGAPFKFEVTNTLNALSVLINQRSYTWGHGVNNPDNFYYSIGIASPVPDLKITSVAVISNGVRKEIGIQDINFENRG